MTFNITKELELQKIRQDFRKYLLHRVKSFYILSIFFVNILVGIYEEQIAIYFISWFTVFSGGALINILGILVFYKSGYAIKYFNNDISFLKRKIFYKLICNIFYYPNQPKFFRIPNQIFLMLSGFLFSPKTQKDTFEPLHGDWQEEYFEALFKKEIWKARWINVRYAYAFISAMWQKSPIGDLIEFFNKIAK